MKKQPLVTVVVLNFNGLKYLKRTIPKILELKYPNLETIVVDNGSEDGSVEYVKTFEEISLLESTPKASKNHACNYAVQEARGEYILMLDNDILIEDEDLVNKLVEIKSPKKFIQVPIINEGAEFTDFYGIFFTYYGLSIRKKQVKLDDILKYGKDEFDIGAPYAAIYFFNRKSWLDIGGLDVVQNFVLDDIDIGPRAWIMGIKCVLYTKTHVVHIGIGHRDESEVLVKRFKLRFSGFAISMIKNYTFFSFVKVFPFFCIVQLVQSTRYAFLKKNFRILTASCASVCFFVKKLPYLLKQRKRLQSQRVVQKDIFLNLRLPSLD